MPSRERTIKVGIQAGDIDPKLKEILQAISGVKKAVNVEVNVDKDKILQEFQNLKLETPIPVLFKFDKAALEADLNTEIRKLRIDPVKIDFDLGGLNQHLREIEQILAPIRGIVEQLRNLPPLPAAPTPPRPSTPEEPADAAPRLPRSGVAGNASRADQDFVKKLRERRNELRKLELEANTPLLGTSANRVYSFDSAFKKRLVADREEAERIAAQATRQGVSLSNSLGKVLFPLDERQQKVAQLAAQIQQRVTLSGLVASVSNSGRGIKTTTTSTAKGPKSAGDDEIIRGVAGFKATEQFNKREQKVSLDNIFKSLGASKGLEADANAIVRLAKSKGLSSEDLLDHLGVTSFESGSREFEVVTRAAEILKSSTKKTKSPRSAGDDEIIREVAKFSAEKAFSKHSLDGFTSKILSSLGVNSFESKARQIAKAAKDAGHDSKSFLQSVGIDQQTPGTEEYDILVRASELIKPTKTKKTSTSTAKAKKTETEKQALDLAKKLTGASFLTSKPVLGTGGLLESLVKTSPVDSGVVSEIERIINKPTADEANILGGVIASNKIVKEKAEARKQKTKDNTKQAVSTVAGIYKAAFKTAGVQLTGAGTFASPQDQIKHAQEFDRLVKRFTNNSAINQELRDSVNQVRSAPTKEQREALDLAKQSIEFQHIQDAARASRKSASGSQQKAIDLATIARNSAHKLDPKDFQTNFEKFIGEAISSGVDKDVEGHLQRILSGNTNDAEKLAFGEVDFRNKLAKATKKTPQSSKTLVERRGAELAKKLAVSSHLSGIPVLGQDNLLDRLKAKGLGQDLEAVVNRFFTAPTVEDQTEIQSAIAAAQLRAEQAALKKTAGQSASSIRAEEARKLRIEREKRDFRGSASNEELFARLTGGVDKQIEVRKKRAKELEIDKAFPGLADILINDLVDPTSGKVNKGALPGLLKPSNLRDPKVLGQIGFSAVFGGLPGAAIGLLAGATPLGAGGVLAASTIQQGAAAITEPFLHAIKEKQHEFEEAGLAFQKSILGISAVLQSTTQVATAAGSAVGLGAQLKFQESRGREIQLAARGQLLPLGIAGSTESTFVQGIVSALASRGFVATPKQVGTIAERIGGAIITQRPQLLDNTTLLLRDLQDLLTGGPQAQRVLIGQLAGIRQAVPAIRNATSIDDYIKALEPARAFADAAKGSENISAVQQRLAGAKDNLNTLGGVQFFEALKPALINQTAFLQAPETTKAFESMGDILGKLSAFALDASTSFSKLGISLLNGVVDSAKFTSAIVDFVSPLTDFALKIPSGIGDTLKSVGDLVGKGFEKIGGVGGGAVGDFVNLVSTFVPGAGLFGLGAQDLIGKIIAPGQQLDKAFNESDVSGFLQSKINPQDRFFGSLERVGISREDITGFRENLEKNPFQKLDQVRNASSKFSEFESKTNKEIEELRKKESLARESLEIAQKVKGVGNKSDRAFTIGQRQQELADIQSQIADKESILDSIKPGQINEQLKAIAEAKQQFKSLFSGTGGAGAFLGLDKTLFEGPQKDLTSSLQGVLQADFAKAEAIRKQAPERLAQIERELAGNQKQIEQSLNNLKILGADIEKNPDLLTGVLTPEQSKERKTLIGLQLKKRTLQNDKQDLTEAVSGKFADEAFQRLINSSLEIEQKIFEQRKEGLQAVQDANSDLESLLQTLLTGFDQNTGLGKRSALTASIDTAAVQRENLIGARRDNSADLERVNKKIADADKQIEDLYFLAEDGAASQSRIDALKREKAVFQAEKKVFEARGKEISGKIAGIDLRQLGAQFEQEQFDSNNPINAQASKFFRAGVDKTTIAGRRNLLLADFADNARELAIVQKDIENLSGKDALSSQEGQTLEARRLRERELLASRPGIINQLLETQKDPQRNKRALDEAINKRRDLDAEETAQRKALNETLQASQFALTGFNDKLKETLLGREGQIASLAKQGKELGLVIPDFLDDEGVQQEIQKRNIASQLNNLGRTAGVGNLVQDFGQLFLPSAAGPGTIQDQVAKEQQNIVQTIDKTQKELERLPKTFADAADALETTILQLRQLAKPDSQNLLLPGQPAAAFAGAAASLLPPGLFGPVTQTPVLPESALEPNPYFGPKGGPSPFFQFEDQQIPLPATKKGPSSSFKIDGIEQDGRGIDIEARKLKERDVASAPQAQSGSTILTGISELKKSFEDMKTQGIVVVLDSRSAGVLTESTAKGLNQGVPIA